MLKTTLFAGALVVAVAAIPAAAQDMSVPTVTTADPGMLFPNDAQARAAEQRRLNRAAGRPDNWGLPGSQRRKAGRRAPSINDVPIAERRRMEAEYKRRYARYGQGNANAWAREQGRLWRARLLQR